MLRMHREQLRRRPTVPVGLGAELLAESQGVRPKRGPAGRGQIPAGRGMLGQILKGAAPEAAASGSMVGAKSEAIPRATAGVTVGPCGQKRGCPASVGLWVGNAGPSKPRSDGQPLPLPMFYTRSISSQGDAERQNGKARGLRAAEEVAFLEEVRRWRQQCVLGPHQGQAARAALQRDLEVIEAIDDVARP